MNIRIPQSKNAARIAKTYLKSIGLSVSHSEALELIARLHGYQNNQAMQADARFDEAIVLKAESSNEFILQKNNTAWISVGNISVAVRHADEGVITDIYPKGAETTLLTSAQCFFVDAELNEDEETV